MIKHIIADDYEVHSDAWSDAIAESKESGATVNLCAGRDYQKIFRDLKAECTGHTNYDEDSHDFWGSDTDENCGAIVFGGGAWRVRLVASVSLAAAGEGEL